MQPHLYSSSDLIARARTYFIPKGRRRKLPVGYTPKQFQKFQRSGAYCNDKREYYRQEYLKSEHWKQLKAAKLRATPYCERCGSVHNLDVHHLDYKNLYDVLLTDLETLCRRCHDSEHKEKAELV